MTDGTSGTITVHHLAPGAGLVDLNRALWEPLPVSPLSPPDEPGAGPRGARRLHAHW